MCEVKNASENITENESKNEGPETLYHYCSVQTFYNIITNHSIWLSDLTKTNDATELIWLKEIVRENILSDAKKHMATDNEDEFWGWNYAKEFLTNLDTGIACWGFCLSLKNNNIGQWKWYGSEGTGISIGFDYHELSKIIKLNTDIALAESDLTLGEVHYGPNEGIRQELRKDAEDLVKKKGKKITEFINGSKNKYVPEIKPIPEVLNTVALEMVVLRRFPFYKMEEFKEEAEYRIVFSMPKKKFDDREFENYNWGTEISFEEYKYEIRKDMLVSHLDIRFTNFRGVIKSVTIGPKSKLTEKDVELFLKANDVYSESIKIKKSMVPYR